MVTTLLTQHSGRSSLKLPHTCPTSYRAGKQVRGLLGRDGFSCKTAAKKGSRHAVEERRPKAPGGNHAHATRSAVARVHVRGGGRGDTC